MTSPSPTKRPTTLRRSTREPGACIALAAALLLAVASPSAAAWRDLQSTAPPILLREPGSTPGSEADVSGAPLPPARAAVDAAAVTDGQSAAPAEPTETSGPCGGDADDCREELDTLRNDPIGGIDIDIRVIGVEGRDYPCECRLEGKDFEPRRFATTTFTWKAAGYCHKPLYFEHWNLERYGHSHGFVADSFLSAAHFFGRLPTLPYQMGVELPWECVYPLGYYRPGSCAPWTVPAVPVSGRGLAVGAATATGLVFLLP